MHGLRTKCSLNVSALNAAVSEVLPEEPLRSVAHSVACIAYYGYGYFFIPTLQTRH